MAETLTLPHEKITRIENNRPYASPSLWNARYDEIDENFNALKEAVEQANSDIETASGLMTPDPEEHFVEVYGSSTSGGSSGEEAGPDTEIEEDFVSSFDEALKG